MWKHNNCNTNQGREELAWVIFSLLGIFRCFDLDLTRPNLAVTFDEIQLEILFKI